MTSPPPHTVSVGEPVAVSREQAIRALGGAYRRITETLRALPEPDYARPTRCAGWTVADLLFHLLLDAQRALVTCATPTDAPTDADYVSYWVRYWAHDRSGDVEHPRDREQKAAAHARFVRISAAAFASPRSLFQMWTETSEAAVRAAGAAPSDARLATQGRVLTLADFMATLAVEAAIHQLDLDLPREEPDPDALNLTRRTLDGLLGAGTVRPDWPAAAYALKATGRQELDPAERAVLGDAAARFPLIS